MSSDSQQNLTHSPNKSLHLSVWLTSDLQEVMWKRAWALMASLGKRMQPLDVVREAPVKPQMEDVSFVEINLGYVAFVLFYETS